MNRPEQGLLIYYTFLSNRSIKKDFNKYMNEYKNFSKPQLNGTLNSTKDYYFILDRVNMKEITIDWCPTKKMVADYMSKPLQGSLFRELRDYIMGRVRCIRPKSDVISLGQKKCIEKSTVNGKRRITVTGSKKCAKVMTQ